MIELQVREGIQNKLASLEATQAQNYDQSTDRGVKRS